MKQRVAEALAIFTQRYIQHYQCECGHLPVISLRNDAWSPCLQQRLNDDQITWSSHSRCEENDLSSVEDALELVIQPSITAWYTSQYAGDMDAKFCGRPCSLIQIWNNDDFIHLQENLIGHLVMKRELKQSPTVFIATLESDFEVISVCNITGEVILETLGKKQRCTLAKDIPAFLDQLHPLVISIPH
ncbi:MAG: Protein Syd [Candidatus Erwinia impunctatus]|nr:Protein Syd [Culicoides impunctatus]